MSNRSGFQTIVLLTPAMFLLLPLSCIIFALERVSQTLLVTQATRNWTNGDYELTVYGPTNSTGKFDYTDIVLRTNLAPTLSILGICALAFVVSIIACCGIWELRRIQGSVVYQRVWCWTIIGTNLVVVTASTAVLVWASLLQTREGWKDYTDVAREGSEYTRETWFCQINKFFPRQNWAGPACACAQTTRYMVISLIVSAVLILLVTGILARDRGGMGWLFGGKGRYAGIAGATEMYSVAPQQPQYYTQPPQYQPQPHYPQHPQYPQYPQQQPPQAPFYPVQPSVSTKADDSSRPVFR